MENQSTQPNSIPEPQQNTSFETTKLDKILATPGAKSLLLICLLTGGIIGIMIMYAMLNYWGGQPIKIDCTEAIKQCKNVITLIP